MKALQKLAVATVLSLTAVSPSFAAIEIDEENFGPTYGSMVADATVGKPLQTLAVVGGVAAYVVSSPAQDAYYKSTQAHENQVRLVVDGPSEIFINTDQNVVVTQP